MRIRRRRRRRSGCRRTVTVKVVDYLMHDVNEWRPDGLRSSGRTRDACGADAEGGDNCYGDGVVAATGRDAAGQQRHDVVARLGGLARSESAQLAQSVVE